MDLTALSCMSLPAAACGAISLAHGFPNFTVTPEQIGRAVKHRIAAVTTPTFLYDNLDRHVLRFCFAKEDATLEGAAERLCAI